MQDILFADVINLFTLPSKYLVSCIIVTPYINSSFILWPPIPHMPYKV